jgi:hypothetical protein
MDRLPRAAPTLPFVEGEQPQAGVAPAVRAQLLATEHWSLLATRSTMQGEILSRISTFLMLVSSSVVGLALVGQVTRFNRWFVALALVLLGMLVIIGTLTQMRVGNAALEDLALVIGMNRLRAGYTELDPGFERYLITSAHDDDRSVWQTYNPLMGRHQLSNVLASSGTFITVVTSGLAGAFGALVVVAFSGPGVIIAVVGAGCGLAFLLSALLLGMRRFTHLKRSTEFPRGPERAGTVSG